MSTERHGCMTPCHTPITPPLRNDTAVAAVFCPGTAHHVLSVLRPDAIHVLFLFRRICGVLYREFASVQIISFPINDNGGVRPVETQDFASPGESCAISHIDNTHVTVALTCVSRAVKPDSFRRIITPINSACLLVRRKILRLYFSLPANYRTYLLLIIMMASACRDAKSCVSRAINPAMTGA